MTDLTDHGLCNVTQSLLLTLISLSILQNEGDHSGQMIRKSNLQSAEEKLLSYTSAVKGDVSNPCEIGHSWTSISLHGPAFDEDGGVMFIYEYQMKTSKEKAVYCCLTLYGVAEIFLLSFSCIFLYCSFPFISKANFVPLYISHLLPLLNYLLLLLNYP